jgi:tetratricopeptide (TPR) repeat protein
MRSKGWLLAAALVVTPAVAHAQAVLDRPHTKLGEGTTLVVEGRYAEAEKPLREALRLDPSLGEAHYNLAVVLKHTGMLDESIAEFHRALALFTDEPDRAKAFYGIGLAREARGDKGAWNEYIVFARPIKAEQPAVQIAEAHRDELNGVKVPGKYQKASR